MKPRQPRPQTTLKKPQPAASNRLRTSRAATPPAADDLQIIRGIGPAIERRLQKAGILTFAQLAALSPADVANLVAGLPTKRIAEQDWIGQARKLAATHKRSLTQAQDKLAPLSHRQHYATFTVELLLNEKNRVRRTRVVHIQDQEENTWPGWKDERLIGFFTEQAALRVPATRPPSRAAQRRPPATKLAPLQEPEAALPVPAIEPISPHEPETKLQLDFGKVTLHQVPPTWAEGGPPFRKHMRAEINFRLSGRMAEQMAANESSYFVQLLADELTTRQKSVLATGQGQLQPELLNYTMTIEFPLPGLGRYQLSVMVTLPEKNIVKVTPGPVLNVVP